MKISNWQFWFRVGAWLLIVTAAIHSMSFFIEPQPANEQERQLMDLMQNYKMDMGLGFQRSFLQLFTFMSLCMTFLCAFAGLTNLLVLPHLGDFALARKMVRLNFGMWTVILLPAFLLTFPPPITCLVLIWLAYALAFFLFRSGKVIQ